MLPAILYDYLKQECDALMAAHRTLQEHPSDHDAVHELRTGVKKLRAFFELASQLPDLHFKAGSYLRRLRLLQTIAGFSRDAQLKKKALLKYEKPLQWRFSYAHLLLQNKQLDANTLLHTAVKRVKAGFLATLPDKFHHATKDIDVKAATQQLMAHLFAQYHQLAPPETKASHTVWHALRKKTKHLYYHFMILTPMLASYQHSARLVKFTKTGGELLGEWHDASELQLFVQQCIRQLKKEKAPPPVNATQLLNAIRKDTRIHLAQCIAHMRQAPVFIGV
ncbi:CHAD domain-containing protein [Chitinophaga vietnamensis]|uniref:CHAD domain-containing protein n=1 Tax=Chitinophaga vietnamensis TaxID=2593957 RepID=UPI001178AF20|nr:CHAD domain-containing protein [Chitinophaga vietnamensis]